MAQDKYSAVWVSHSSMGDFLRCPRLYYLRNVYKDSKTKNKINIVSPHMSLGVAVHEVLEGLADFPSESRMDRDLLAWFDDVWKKYSGKVGGFKDASQEKEFKARGVTMLESAKKDPKFLIHKRIKLPREVMNPNFFISDEENIILNGLIDWIEYIPETNSLHIVDFKTGKKEETENSLQLPIYLLLCNALQKRIVTKASYWYLESGKVVEKELPDADTAFRDVLAVALRVKAARTKNEFECSKGNLGCMHCIPFEKVLRGEAEFVGTGTFKQDLYFVE